MKNETFDCFRNASKVKTIITKGQVINIAKTLPRHRQRKVLSKIIHVVDR